MIKIPGESKKWNQQNRSDLLGNLWSTWNVDLQSNVGAVKISPRLKLSTSTTDDADLGVPVAFKYFNSRIWALCGTNIFSNGGGVDDTFTDDVGVSSGAQNDHSADESDMEVFNGTLCATTTDSLWSSDGSTWTSRDTLNTGSAHLMTYFKKFDRLYYTNQADNVISINGSWSTADPGADYAISLSTSTNSYTITSIKASANRIWIGVVDLNDLSAPGKILEWDGFSADVINEHKLNNYGCMAIAINPRNGSPYAIDGSGVVYSYSGNGFTEVARLPLNENVAYNPADSDNERFIHPNGFVFGKNGTLLMLVNNRPNVSASVAVKERFPSGVWEFSETNGLSHRYSFSYNPVGSSTITDYGQNRVSRVGALAIFDLQRNSTTEDGSLLAGATFYTDASSTSSGIFIDNSLNTIRKNGYFVTQKIFSPNVSENWEKFYLRFKRFLSSNDRITIKWRTFDLAPTEATITWTALNQFTTTTDVSAYYDSTNSIGYEVEVLQGKGSGKCAQITAISENAGTYTVTVDEDFTGVSAAGTSKARFQKWIKGKVEDRQGADLLDVTLKEKSNWIQFKVVMDSTGDNEIYDIILEHSKHI